MYVSNIQAQTLLYYFNGELIQSNGISLKTPRQGNSLLSYQSIE